MTSQNTGEKFRIANIIDLTEQKSSEQALRKSEEQFRRLFEDAPMGICLVGPDGLIQQANPAMTHLTGYAEHEIVGQTYALYTHPDDLTGNLDLTRQLFEGKHTNYEYKKRYICKSGELKWVSVFVSAMHHESAVGPTAVAVVEDITEQKRYEESLTEMNVALAHAMPGISQIDESGCYISVNENYANFLGREPSELLGRSWESMEYPEDLPIAHKAYNTMRQTGTGEFEARGIRKDGSMFYKHVLMVKADRVKNPGVSLHCFMRDISERKEVETALQISEQSIRELYEITSAQSTTFEEKIRALLHLGCQRFQLPIGTLTKLIEENLELEFLHDPTQSWNEHTLVPICDSFCGKTITQSAPLIFEDVSATEWKHTSAYKSLGLEAYIGTKLLVGNRVYGSLCFLDRKAHGAKFTPSDIHFLQLMARWIGGELERKHAKDALHEANERLLTLSQQLLTVQETERRQLAHDLHDEIGQTLTVVKLNLQTLQSGKPAASVPGALQDSMQILDHMLKHVRELSLDLRPSMLDDLGLVSAVRWFVNRQAERAGWKTEILIEDTLPNLPPDFATASFRVIQEALTNVMRHAQATHVRVHLQIHQRHLEILVADNGVGFDSLKILEQAASGQSFGLLSMQERIRFLDGRITITSQRGQGTRIKATLPVQADVTHSLSQ